MEGLEAGTVLRNQQVAGSIPAGGSSNPFFPLYLLPIRRFAKIALLASVPIFVPTPPRQEGRSRDRLKPQPPICHFCSSQF